MGRGVHGGRPAAPAVRAGRTASAVVAALTLGAALTGCDVATNSRIDYSDTERATITEIRVNGGGGGDVTVRGGGPAGEVRIDRIVRYRGGQPGTTYRVDGGTLHLDTRCGRRCSVSYTVQAPTGVAVRGENGSGDVSLTGVAAVDVQVGSGSIEVSDSSADVTTKAGSGDVTVRSVAGRLDAETGSGTIDARDVMAGPTSVRTGSGDVTLTLGRPCAVRGHVGSGDLTVTVPVGSYRVETNTGSGRATVGLTHDPNGEHLLDLESGSGDITVLGRTS